MSPNQRNMGGASSKREEELQIEVNALLNHRDGEFRLDPALTRFYGGAMKNQFQEAQVAVVSVIGPPTSGKSRMLHEAMLSLVRQKKNGVGLRLKSAATGRVTSPNRVLLWTPPVEIDQKKKKLIVFGMDIDSREYDVDVYEKLVDFVVSVSSVTIVIIPNHYEPGFWDCKKNMARFTGRPRLQNVGIVVQEEATSPIPKGKIDVANFIQLYNFDEKKIEAVLAVHDVCSSSQVFILPTLETDERPPDGLRHHEKFFESLFKEVEPVERNKGHWDFHTFQENIKHLSQALNQTNPFPRQEQAVSSPGHASRPPFPRPPFPIHDYVWFTKTYDEKFADNIHQRQLLCASVEQVKQIHQVIEVELLKIREDSNEVTLDALRDLLRTRFEFHSQKQQQECNHFKTTLNELNYACLQEKYNLAVLALQPASLPGTTYSDQNLCSKCDAIISALTANFKQYFSALYADFRSDLKSAVEMIEFHRQKMNSVLLHSLCVTDELLKHEHETILDLLGRQETFRACMKGGVDLRDVISKATVYHLSWISEVNKNRLSLETQLIATAIEKVVAKYRSSLSEYASNQILSQNQLSHLHEQLFRAVRAAFVLKNCAKGFQIPFLWEISLQKLNDAIQIEFRKIYLQNSKRLEDYIKRRKMLLRICVNKYQEILAQSPTKTEESVEEARQAVMEFFRLESAQQKIEDAKTLERTLEVAIGRNVTPHSSIASVPKPVLSSSVAVEKEVEAVNYICIHVMTSEIVITWPGCPESAMKFLPLLTISEGVAAVGDAARELYEKDKSNSCNLFDIIDLISSGLPPSQNSIKDFVGNMVIECAEDIIAVFFNSLVSSIPELANWKRSCVIITSAGTLPDARIRLQAATTLAGIQILRILNPTTALCLSYFYDCLEKPRMLDDHELLLLASDDEERTYEVQIGTISQSAIKTRNARIITSPKNCSLIEVHKLLAESSYTPETLNHQLLISDHPAASCAKLLLQNQNLQLIPTRAGEAMYAGVLAWICSGQQLETIQSVAVEATFSIPRGANSIKLTAMPGVRSVWKELKMDKESVVFMYQQILKLVPDVALNQSKPFKLTVPSAESNPEGRIFYASMNSNGIISLEVKTEAGVFPCSLDGMLCASQLQPRWFNASSNPSASTSYSPLTCNASTQVYVEEVKTNVPAESSPPPHKISTSPPKSPIEAQLSPQEKLQALIQQMSDRISEGTIRGPTKKLLEKRIQEAKSRLDAPDATSKLYEAAYRSLQATAQALDEDDDQD